MAVALPLYLSAISDAQRKTCRANLQTIANAVQSARVKTNAIDYGALISGGVTIANLTPIFETLHCAQTAASTLCLLEAAALIPHLKLPAALRRTVHSEPGVDSN